MQAGLLGLHEVVVNLRGNGPEELGGTSLHCTLIGFMRNPLTTLHGFVADWLVFLNGISTHFEECQMGKSGGKTDKRKRPLCFYIS